MINLSPTSEDFETESDMRERNTHRQIDDLVTECRRLEALLLEESRVSAARFHALNEVRALVGLPKVDDDPILGLADAVRAAVRPSDAQ